MGQADRGTNTGKGSLSVANAVFAGQDMEGGVTDVVLYGPVDVAPNVVAPAATRQHAQSTVFPGEDMISGRYAGMRRKQAPDAAGWCEVRQAGAGCVCSASCHPKCLAEESV